MGAVIGDDGLITVGDRSIRAIACPIGIDAENFAETVKGDVARAAWERMVTSANGRQLIVGVDRLDYSKGVEERFLGYERFLASHASRAGAVFLLQDRKSVV